MRKIRVLDNVYDLITINMEDRFKDNVAFRFYDTANDAVSLSLLLLTLFMQGRKQNCCFTIVPKE